MLFLSIVLCPTNSNDYCLSIFISMNDYCISIFISINDYCVSMFISINDDTFSLIVYKPELLLLISSKPNIYSLCIFESLWTNSWLKETGLTWWLSFLTLEIIWLLTYLLPTTSSVSCWGLIPITCSLPLLYARKNPWS